MPSSWSEKHVRRLFWRAGLGATPEEARRWAAAGSEATIRFMLDGGRRAARLVGPEPRANGGPLDPVNEWGHDALWWLDRMVRTERPLQEKMTLFWHDHFATRDQETPYMLRQNRMLRTYCLGSFRRLLRGVTTDPAMQLFLSLADSSKWAPNENYARELMELFTLGHGYGERDVREAARALTGWRAKWTGSGLGGIWFDRSWHDRGVKRILGKRGRFDWKDTLRIVTSHKGHAPFIVDKLWAFFITEPIDAATRRALVLPGIDYSNPDLSHFHSRHFWETGLVTPKSATGWLGRMLDRTGNRDNPLQGVSMSGGLSPTLRSASAPVAALTSPNAAQFWIPDVWGKSFEYAMAAYEELARRPVAGAGAAAATANTLRAKQVADILKPYRKDSKTGENPLAGSLAYPRSNRLADRLQNLAGLLAQPLGIRVAAVDADGDFDTHDRQSEDLTEGLKEVSEALSAFQADVEARGLADRVLTLVWSEFGRRPQQNNSNGTDHGAGGLAFVMGTRANGGVLTDYPDLHRFDDDGNLAVTVDFRRVYCSLLEQWMGTDAGAVIPGAEAFGRLKVAR